MTGREANVPTLLQAGEKAHEKAESGWKHAEGRNARRWLSSVKMHLAWLLECRVDTLEPRDFSDYERLAETSAVSISSCSPC